METLKPTITPDERAEAIHEYDSEGLCMHCGYTGNQIDSPDNTMDPDFCMMHFRTNRKNKILKTQGNPETVRIEHSKMVKALVKDGELILETMTPLQMHVLHMAVGISGEAGEVIDAVKKWCIYQTVLDVDNIIEELGDIEFYMEGLRQAFGIEREATLEANYRKLGKRYENHIYSDAQAAERKDKPQGE